MKRDHITHHDLLAQVAHTEAERSELHRLLGADLQAALERRANRIPRIHGRFADTMPSDPAPLADGVDIDAVHRRLPPDDGLAPARGIVIALALTAACIAAAGLLHWAFR